MSAARAEFETRIRSTNFRCFCGSNRKPRSGCVLFLPDMALTLSRTSVNGLLVPLSRRGLRQRHAKKHTATIADLARPYLERFQALLAVALPEDAPLVRLHGCSTKDRLSVSHSARRPVTARMDLELLPMLSYPLVRHS